MRKPRKHAQIIVFASVEPEIHEVAYSRADDGTAWRMVNPDANGQWVRLPDLPDIEEEQVNERAASWAHDYGRQFERRG